MKSFNEWLEENNLLNEFDPNRGADGRKKPMGAPKGFQHAELDNPNLRKRRLKQIYGKYRDQGTHYGDKALTDKELDDPMVQKIRQQYRKSQIGGSEHDLTILSGSGDKRSLAQKEKDFTDEQENYLRSKARGEKSQSVYKKHMDKTLSDIKGR
jgi:hypothetical protein